MFESIGSWYQFLRQRKWANVFSRQTFLSSLFSHIGILINSQSRGWITAFPSILINLVSGYQLVSYSRFIVLAIGYKVFQCCMLVINYWCLEPSSSSVILSLFFFCRCKLDGFHNVSPLAVLFWNIKKIPTTSVIVYVNLAVWFFLCFYNGVCS